MKSQQAMETLPEAPSPARPIFVEAEKLIEQMKEFSESVAHRAYEYFQERGGELGHELEDWVHAESELMVSVAVEIKESEKQVVVRAQVPGFAADEIKVIVEPQRLVVSGKAEKVMKENKKETLLSEFRSNQFCRELRLPAEVDPAKTTAVLKDGVLELVFAKVDENRAVSVAVKPE